MDRSLTTLRRLTKKELEELPAEKLLNMDGLVPLSKACKRFGLNTKQIRNATRKLSEEEQLEQLGVINIREENAKYPKVFVVLGKMKDLLELFNLDKPEYLSLADHDFMDEPEPPEGWYKLGDVLYHYPLLRTQLEGLKQSRWFRSDYDLVHLPGALTLFEE